MVLIMRREKKRSFLHIVQLPADFDNIAEESLAGEDRETPGSDCKAEQNFESLGFAGFERQEGGQADILDGRYRDYFDTVA